MEVLNDPQLQAKLEQFQQRVAQLRFAEGLRRNAEQVRAECNLHFAQDLAFSEGARTHLTVLRELSLTTAAEPAQVEAQIAYNYWRMQLWVAQQWAPLNPRREKTGGMLKISSAPATPAPLTTPSLLATLHKLACAQMPVPASAVSIPRAEALQSFLSFEKLKHVPLFWRLGLQVAQGLQTEIFTAGNTAVLLTYLRHQLVETGLEPTGCLRFTFGWTQHLPELQTWVAQLKRQASARETGQLAFTDPQQVEQWLLLWADVFLESFTPSEFLVKAVQAGKLPENL